MEHSKIAALVELGILCRGEDVETHGDGSMDVGPYEFSQHNQLARYEHPHYQYPFQDKSQPAYLHFQSETTMQKALEQTRLIVLLGIADAKELRDCLGKPDTIVLMFEPDDRVLKQFLEATQLASLNREGVFCFTGNPYSFNPSLQEMLPDEIFKQGTPAFFLTDRIKRLYGDWAEQVTEYLEILHYRHVIYRVSGQFLMRSIPFRKIKRDLIYDQQLHAYENIPEYLIRPGVSQLKNRLRGNSAILVAAGPDLNSQFDYIRKNRHRAVIICVNNALKPLIEAGVRPHFVVINDISVASGEVFKQIPKAHEVILVGQVHSDLGGDKFRQKYLFGDYLPYIFGENDDLDLHGSVITTAFSLAEHLGCTRCVFVGAQLASSNPWSLAYAKGTVNGVKKASLENLPNQYPQLYPVKTPFGETCYTTLNFRDAALWLSENIRLSGIECINTSKSSILYGRGIRYESEPVLPDVQVSRAVADLFHSKPVNPDYVKVLHFIAEEKRKWSTVLNLSARLLAEGDQLLMDKGLVVLEQFDNNNITYLVERYDGFDNKEFYRKVFQEGESSRLEGLQYYFAHVQRMSECFIQLLQSSEAACNRLKKDAGPSF